MAKSEFSSEVRDEYKENVREIKVKGNLVLHDDGIEEGNMLSLSAFNGYTSDDLLFTTNANRVRITGNTPTSGIYQYYYPVQITENNFDVFNIKRATQLYKFKMKILNNEYNTSLKVKLLIYRNNDYEGVFEISENWEIYDLLTKRGYLDLYIPGYPEYVEIKGIEFYFMTPSGSTHDVDLELELNFCEEDITKITGDTLMPDYIGSKDLGNNVSVSINKNIFTFNGTSNASADKSLLPTDYPLSSFILPAGNYIFRGIKQSGSGDTIYPNIFYREVGGGSSNIQLNSSNLNTYTFKSDIEIIGLSAWFNSNYSYNGEFNFTIFEDQIDNGTFIIGENGKCQILDFRVDETSDIYYESMPFSELNVDVDNSDGYFSDFSETSIVSQLNKNCYIDFYLNVNNTGWCRTWTMQFDSLKADNQKATLTFKPYCMSTYNSMIYDKNKILNNYPSLTKERLADLIYDNYGVELTAEAQYGFVLVNDDGVSSKVSDLLYRFAGDLPVLEEPQMLTISDNKFFKYKLISFSDEATLDDELDDDVILEKPLITKETLEGYVLNYQYIMGVISNDNKLQKSITSIFRNSHETLLIYCDDLEARDITQNDITLTNATFEWLGTITRGSTFNYGMRYILLEISGNVGDRYTIDIDATIRKIDITETQKVYSKGQYENIDNFIKIFGFNNGFYWRQLMDNMEKKIELKIKALPYLQVGDKISVNDEEKYVITEIHTSWSNGFIMDVKAYKINYATS